MSKIVEMYIKLRVKEGCVNLNEIVTKMPWKSEKKGKSNGN